jgi:hypothetical protein
VLAIAAVERSVRRNALIDGVASGVGRSNAAERRNGVETIVALEGGRRPGSFTFFLLRAR